MFEVMDVDGDDVCCCFVVGLDECDFVCGNYILFLILNEVINWIVLYWYYLWFLFRLFYLIVYM